MSIVKVRMEIIIGSRLVGKKHRPQIESHYKI